MRSLVSMKYAVFVLGVAVAFSSVVESNFLEEFHESLSEVAQLAGEDLEYYRAYNGALIKEFNRELLLSFGIMVPTLRTNDVEFMQSLEELDNVTDECLEYVKSMRDILITLQNNDVNNCARWAWISLEEDTMTRFWPYHNSFAREFVRATTQVVQTLGRNRIDRDQDAINAELAEELAYFENLRDGQGAVLWEEISAHADMADATYRNLEECREITKLMQQFDHDYLLTLMENCLENGVW